MAKLDDFNKIIHNGNEISKVLHQGQIIWQKEPFERGVTYSLASAEWWAGTTVENALTWHKTIMLQVPSGATKITTVASNSAGGDSNIVQQVHYDKNKNRLELVFSPGNPTTTLNIPSNVGFIVLIIPMRSYSVSQVWRVTFKFA